MKSCHPSFRVLLSWFLLLGLRFVSLSTLVTTELVWTLISSILFSPSLLTLCSPSKPPSTWLSEKLFYHVHISLILLLANFTFSIISPLFWGYNIKCFRMLFKTLGLANYLPEFLPDHSCPHSIYLMNNLGLWPYRLLVVADNATF